ncbi:hypothetical protein SH668x_003579 [Planctomicrobium sp. SH668]|uniref:hypothetical protein n=1 Tax=Planctomicrobium sp. SH668 TaxID=3448126 RepID=UPI003F5C8536
MILRSRRLLCFILPFVLSVSSGVDAADLRGEFLQGVIQRQYYEIAQETLDSLKADLELPQDLQELLDLQQGLILRGLAATEASPENRKQMLEQACTCIGRFLAQHGDHPMRDRAKWAISESRIEQARSVVHSASSLTQEEMSEEVRFVLREGIHQARLYLSQLNTLYQEQWEKYPLYIAAEDHSLKIARNQAFERYLRSQFDLAQCDYWESLTYPEVNAVRGRLLTRAGNAYGEIHQRYRSQLGGLYARLWQGKCYEALKSVEGTRLALGIYGEIIEHDGTSPSLISIKETALLFRLNCLNSKFRKDYQLVEIEALDWLDSHPERAETAAGLGIEWQLVVALARMSEEKEWARDTQRDFQMRALEHAAHVASVPNDNQTDARQMVESTSAESKGENSPSQ